MVIPSEKYGKFVALLAHDGSATLQMQQLQDTCRNALVLTSTQDNTVTAITNELFNLIIVDRGINNFNLISIIKTAGGINCRTPAIALVDNDNLEQRKNLVADGFDDCLTKPLTADVLDAVIQFWRGNDVLSTVLNSIQVLLAKCNNNSLVLRLYKKLYEELSLQAVQIGEALENRQYEMAFELAHKLNGSAKVCCLKEIGDSANSLETCLILKEYAQASGYFLILRQCIADFYSHRQPVLDYLEGAVDGQ